MGLGFGHDEIHFLKMECEGTYAEDRTPDDSVAFLLYSGGQVRPEASTEDGKKATHTAGRKHVIVQHTG